MLTQIILEINIWIPIKISKYSISKKLIFFNNIDAIKWKNNQILIEKKLVRKIKEIKQNLCTFKLINIKNIIFL
jgi:hypothetical protein